MGDWTFLGKHAQVLLLMTQDPSVRLVDISAALGVTDRTAFALVEDLIEAGYVVKRKEGRRNYYDIEEDLPLHNPIGCERTVGDFLDLFFDPE